ncbi:hypothetical protein [Nostoc sp.]|uniref:hypothetical protein n=1 Tax=Nostoc sp. TaxID=1180 RepID=UPI002FFCFB1F
MTKVTVSRVRSPCFKRSSPLVRCCQGSWCSYLGYQRPLQILYKQLQKSTHSSAIALLATANSSDWDLTLNVVQV